MRYTHILWDWNGTLLDDVDAAVASLCDLLADEGLPPTDAERYRGEVEVPIRRYYEKHFDLSALPFDALAERFMQGYHRHLGLARLRDGAAPALEHLRAAGLGQAVVSSFEQERLLHNIARFGIAHYFFAVSGADDCRAESKTGRAQALLLEYGIDPRRAAVIGDMAHDAHLAAALGCGCILVSGGHQRREELERCGVPVTESLSQAARWVLEQDGRMPGG